MEQFRSYPSELKIFCCFQKNILIFIRPSPSNVFNYDNHKSPPHVGMSHLFEHNFKHNFQDCLNSICDCRLDIESTSHFLLHCPTVNDERYTLLNKIDCKLLELTTLLYYKLQTMFYENTLFDKEKNTLIFNATMNIFYPLKN